MCNKYVLNGHIMYLPSSLAVGVAVGRMEAVDRQTGRAAVADSRPRRGGCACTGRRLVSPSSRLTEPERGGRKEKRRGGRKGEFEHPLARAHSLPGVPSSSFHPRLPHTRARRLTDPHDPKTNSVSTAVRRERTSTVRSHKFRDSRAGSSNCFL